VDRATSREIQKYLKESGYSLDDPEGNYRGNGFLMQELTGPLPRALHESFKTRSVLSLMRVAVLLTLS